MGRLDPDSDYAYDSTNPPTPAHIVAIRLQAESDKPDVLTCETCAVEILDPDDVFKVFGGFLCHECYTASGIDYDGDEESED